MKKQPKITLMGAGPGSADLITIRGLRALRTADVILYDALANPELLQNVSENTLKINVGKRANKHRFSQSEINLMTVSYAFSHGHVVRLKGGDPFIFGRAYEELQYATSFNIETTIVPGVSSSTALVGLQEVPLTHRNYSQGFWVLTGTTKHGVLPKDFYLAAQSNSTLVILMGLRKLAEITRVLHRYGKGNTPVMVIQNGSLPNERVVLGTVDTIVDIVEKEGIQTPAVIVVGQVVALHPDLVKSYAITVNSKN
ncbi:MULTISPECIES: uroporphyrinogen-III C-methyltransferase [unclassified Aureispira]|uniref:uroporphyrinogen-III C-methyltransferase n=1 Tax=unclassified Aureispira TaxID=2649989 RepID=UPI000696DAF8|nr:MULTISPECIES: uroporphyrinogen-III C-methyltransferase [unclassified Aureispira]WMX15851.1 uroporphyrinogen-III C-methyltransferase [Aureispira sp. CCB-E]